MSGATGELPDYVHFLNMVQRDLGNLPPPLGVHLARRLKRLRPLLLRRNATKASRNKADAGW
jgi:hypothetical protein